MVREASGGLPSQGDPWLVIRGWDETLFCAGKNFSLGGGEPAKQPVTI
jgi:hypothetical protein